MTINKLFIYIPTYNRPDALATQLASLMPQVLQYPDHVRLMICDNDSGKTQYSELAKKYADYENVICRKNAGNIGGNANIALGFIFVEAGEFLWILSDNDIVSDKAVSFILSHIDNEIDFYCFNDSVKEPLVVEHDWHNGWDVPMDWRMGLISDGLYNANTIKNSAEDAFYYHNSSFPHLAVACSAAKKKGVVKFKLLPRSEINNSLYGSTECPTDYSLANVCMPLLVPLFPKTAAKAFCLKWLKNHGVYLYRNRAKHYHLYLQSRATLAYYGGFSGRLLLIWMWLLYLLASPLIDVRQKIIETAKRHLSSTTIEKLKKIRSKL